ncbi:hypothetical protein EMCRGX_G010547 [Ephydatia muelleri]
MHAVIELRMPFMPSSSETQVLCTCGPSSPLILNTNSSSMFLQWNAPLQPDYVITAYTLPHRVPSLKSQSEMWAPPSTATVQFHAYNPSGILFYQINSVMTDFLGYQNLQQWSVAHCELQNSSVMLSLYVGASVVQSPPVTYVIARDMVHAAAITAAIVPLLTMKHVSYPLLNGPPVMPAGTAVQLERSVGRHQCCSQPAQTLWRSLQPLPHTPAGAGRGHGSFVPHTNWKSWIHH